MKRTQLMKGDINSAVIDMVTKLNARIQQKGYGSLASTHEIRGMIDEEYNELRDAMHKKDAEAIAEELLDVAVGAIVGYACIKARTVEW